MYNKGEKSEKYKSTYRYYLLTSMNPADSIPSDAVNNIRNVLPPGFKDFLYNTGDKEPSLL